MHLAHHTYISPALDGSKFRIANDAMTQMSLVVELKPWKSETQITPENLNRSKPAPRTDS